MIASMDKTFRHGLKAIIAGDLTRLSSISITDAGTEALVKAYPNLTCITLHGTHNLGRKAFPTILKSCPCIQAVTITIAKNVIFNDTKIDGPILNWLMDKDFVSSLQYLEFRGIALSHEGRRILKLLTHRRKELEIVYEYAGEAVLIRDMLTTPLARVPLQDTTSVPLDSIRGSLANTKGQDDEKKHHLPMRIRPEISNIDSIASDGEEDEWEDEEDEAPLEAAS